MIIYERDQREQNYSPQNLTDKKDSLEIGLQLLKR